MKVIWWTWKYKLGYDEYFYDWWHKSINFGFFTIDWMYDNE